MGKLIQSVCEDLKEQIGDLIAVRRLKPGDRLPSERELCRIFGANRVTLRNALKQLSDEGLLITEHGRGSFIAPEKYVEDGQRFASFSESEEDASSLKSRVAEFSRVEAPRRIADALRLDLGASLFKLMRVRERGALSFLETAYLPEALCPGLDAFDFSSQSLYAVLRQHYGIEPVRQDQVISLTTLTAGEAALLRADKGAPAFCIKGTTLTSTSLPCEYVVSLNPADRFKIRGRLVREL